MAKKKRGKKDDVADQATPDLAADAATGTADEEAESSAEPAAEGGAELPSLEDELGYARADAQEAADRALRTLAEFDNFRRRSERQLGEARASGAADVLRELLDVADNLDRALEHAGDDVPAAFVDGMKLVARGLHDLLDRKGVARMETAGVPFDPVRHEALTVMPAEDVAPNTVMQEVQPGYTLGDRVLRPAKVIVSAAPVEQDGSGA